MGDPILREALDARVFEFQLCDFVFGLIFFKEGWGGVVVMTMGQEAGVYCRGKVRPGV